MNIIITILAISMIIILHELGHFGAAKLSGVKVNEFWLGMGPAILKKEFKGTVYKLNLLPFGGAVVMEGEDSESESSNAFSKTSKLNKAFIMSAGCIMNFLVGFIIVFILNSSFQSTTIESFADGFRFNNDVGFEVNDTILSIDGYEIETGSDMVYIFSLDSNNDTYTFEILRDNSIITLENFYIIPELLPNDEGVLINRYGFNFTEETLPILNRVTSSYKICVRYVENVILSLKMLVTGEASVDEMSGVVALTVMVGEAAEESMQIFWNFIAFISINLGVMNLLPLPALDGGRLILLLVETIRKKPLSPKIEGIIHGTGLLLLLGLMVYVNLHDIFVKILGNK